MKARSKIALVMVGSFALGAAAVQSLHAHATLPGYAIVEVDVTDKEGYRAGLANLNRSISGVSA